MPRTTTVFLALCMAFAMTAAPGARERSTDDAVENILGDAPRYRAFVETLQRAIRTQDATAVASMVDYPFAATIGGRRQVIPDATAFAAQYEAIITPDIALAVQDQAYDGVFVNDRGIMLGAGEIWINGVCEDARCRKSRPRIVTIQAGAAQPMQQSAGTLETFRDWIVGCDNGDDCTAIGTATEANAYIVVARSADRSAEPRIAFRLRAEETVAEPRLRLSATGAVALPAVIAASNKDGLYSATLDGARARGAVQALLPGQTIGIDLLDGDRVIAKAQVSLAGASASLRYMDAEQRRADTVEALVARGTLAVADAAHPRPRVNARPIAAIEPPPARPSAAAAGEDGCGDAPDIAVRLTPDLVLHGVCSFSGAYNVGFRFYIVGPAGAHEARFELPGRAAGDDSDPGVLVNPAVEDDGRTISAFDKGRGIGDCGRITRWAFDGAAMRLVDYQGLDTCMGVSAQDWPVLYRAELAPEK